MKIKYIGEDSAELADGTNHFAFTRGVVLDVPAKVAQYVLYKRRDFVAVEATEQPKKEYRTVGEMFAGDAEIGVVDARPIAVEKPAEDAQPSTKRGRPPKK